MNEDTNVVVEPSEDFLQFMQMLEEGKHLEPFPEETFPPGLTKEAILEISNKFPFNGASSKNNEV